MPLALLSRSVLRQKRLSSAGADAVVARNLRRAEAAGEREVVAVRVLDRQEPQLARLDQLADLRVVLVLGEPARQAAAHLGRDPLARVVDGGEQDRVARAVRHVARVLGHLEREDRLAERRRADLLELHHVRVVGRDGAHLVGDAARLHVGPVDVEERVRAVAQRRATWRRRVDRQRRATSMPSRFERGDLARRRRRTRPSAWPDVGRRSRPSSMSIALARGARRLVGGDVDRVRRERVAPRTRRHGATAHAASDASSSAGARKRIEYNPPVGINTSPSPSRDRRTLTTDDAPVATLGAWRYLNGRSRSARQSSQLPCSVTS